MADPDRLGALVLAREAERQRCLLASDILGLEEILHPDVTYIHASGKRETRDTLLRTIGRTVYLHFGLFAIRCLPVSEFTAILTGGLRTQFLIGDESKLFEQEFTSVWTSQDRGPWQMISWQGTPSLPAWLANQGLR